jgi:DNA-binding transcriptional LysR family regulator
MDRLTSLTVFVGVVDGGGFSAAARRLNMSVTAASKHVQNLEERLGARLLNRTTRKVSLTEVGREYFERANQILAELDEAERTAGALQATPRGLVRLHCATLLIRFLGPVFVEYQTKFPAVSLDVTIGDRAVDLVEEGFDLSILPRPPAESGLIVKRLAPWRYVLCCSPGYLEVHPAPLRPADLVHHNCLRYALAPAGDEWRFRGADGQQEAVKARGDLVTNSGELLRIMTLAGRGILLAPTFAIGEDVKAGRLIRLLPDFDPGALAIHAVYPHRRHLSTKVRSLIDLLAERLAQNKGWMAVEPSENRSAE